MIHEFNFLWVLFLQKILMIMGHRYQKDFQWVRMTHLGRGMFGNCHLASDYNTEYQFCIKKVCIASNNENILHQIL